MILLVYFPLFAQVNNARIEQYALAVPADSCRDISTLAHYLTAPYATELDQISSLFAWISHNIDYDDLAYKQDNRRLNRSPEEVLKRGKGVCLGYAQLFCAMCDSVGLGCRIIEGYSKGTFTARPELKVPDHTWNSVQIDSKWHLLDVTWGASYVQQGNAFSTKADLAYFLTPPETFILDHLPGDPSWQLLDCPVPADIFKTSAAAIRKYLANSSPPCFNYQDSIKQQLGLPFRQQRIAFYQNTYNFNPTPENKKQLGQGYLDLNGELADIAEALQNDNQLDSLTSIHEKMIETFRTASLYTKLFDWQIGLFANTLINRAVAISRTLSDSKSTSQYVNRLETMQQLLEEAINLVDQLKPSLLQLQQNSQAIEYLEWVEEQLKVYRK
ncbi:MAG: hypothetical protein DHS20C18_48060 [Saprospiraceae bacterium]|nr:MAG: hypothetical protein DHS20C18_48060 [Saprospiraceae bacterium]